MDGFTIRAAEAADIPSLAAIEAAVFPTDAWGERELASHLAGVGTLSLLLTDPAGKAIGLVLGVTLPPEGELYRIAVLPAYRGAGLGRLLLAEFLAVLADRGADECYLEVRAENTVAQALYASCGFLQVGRRKNYYKDPRDDALVLKRGS